MVQRVFVEKKPGFDVEALGLLRDLRETLRPDGLSGIRIFNRYDLEGLSEEDFARARDTVLSEPNVDSVYNEQLPELAGYRLFAAEYLPGQYDQRADSAAQCIQLLTGGERPAVATARIYALKGNLPDRMVTKIAHYIINPVESRIASFDKPDTLQMTYDRPDSVETVTGFCEMDDAAIASYHEKMGFAMTPADLCFCREYFQSESRDPTVTELRVIDTYWSDHCRHTTFLTRLTDIEVENCPEAAAIRRTLSEYFAARAETFGKKERDVTLMDMATMGARLLKKRGLIPDLDESEEINACSIEAEIEIDGKPQKWLIQFKNETHNHPTEIEPFGGAATCLGGAIRDPLSGRAYVYQAMRVTGSGDPTLPFETTMRGKLPAKKITTGAASGYSSYGNQIGLATGQVTEFYDRGYTAKRLEIGAVIGASPKENVVRATPAEGDIIVLLGGRTGRDGCGGATGSSKAHDASSIETCGAEVQKGNPPTERKLQRLFRNPAVAQLIKRCNDFGAGGVCVAIGELSDSLIIDLDAVPKKYEGLDGTALAISESQERMAVVLSPADTDAFIAAARAENLEATPVAVVTDSGRLCMNWQGKTIVNITREFLDTNGVTGTASALIKAPEDSHFREKVPACLAGMPQKSAFLKNLSRPEVCCQKGLAERFDSSIGAATVLMPFGGKYQLTPEQAMAAKLPLDHGDTDAATAMSFGFVPSVTKHSPFHGSAFAVMESLSKLAAVGADPAHARLTFQEYFERLHDRPERWGLPAAALLGAFSAQLGMSVPSIGGKDSMSGSFQSLDVPPTLVSFAVAMTKASQTSGCALESSGLRLALLPLPTDADAMPDYEACKKLYRRIVTLVREKKLSVSVVTEGGAAAAAAKMCFGNRLGITFEKLSPATLFAPLSGSLVVAGKDLSLLDGIYCIPLGTTRTDGAFAFENEIITQEEALDAWCGTLENVFPMRSDAKVPMEPEVPLFGAHALCAPAVKAARPRVLIPVFPGTNCEIDSARAFERAGGEADILVVRNLTPADITETAEELVRRIDRANIIMLPGGFSGGDEPDGSGKFIATAFRNPAVAEAVARLLGRRDGLMLGICNGFQALIKLGLVPYGEIREPEQSAPTLTFNTLGRHVSCMAYTRVASVKSPWLAGCEAGELFAIPVSHGEGRFVAEESMLRSLAANGQIATQYVTPENRPAADIPFNPNGSFCAIEGITSPDGRVFGKMGHSERRNTNCYQNIPFEKDQKLFESGIKYFQS